jgi:hypothetical protein
MRTDAISRRRRRRTSWVDRRERYRIVVRGKPLIRQARNSEIWYPSLAQLTHNLRSTVLRTFFLRLLQDVLVQGQVRHQLLELLVLGPQLAQLPDLRRAQAPVLLLPAVERLLGDLELAADLGHRRAGLGLP